MDSLSYKTISANASTVAKEWVVIDATNEVLGRLAPQVAKIIRGKNKPSCGCAKVRKNIHPANRTAKNCGAG